MMAMYNEKNNALNQNWGDFMNRAQSVNWSPEDRHHVIDQLNTNMDMQMLRNVLKAKITDLNFLLDFPGFTEDMKCKVAACIIYTQMAMKVNQMFEYSDNFNSQLVLARFETMNLDELKKVVNSYN